MKRRPIARGRHKPGVMNKIESQYALALEARYRMGEVAWYKFESLTLKLAKDTRYTPDFFVMLADGTLEVHEIKGGFVREDAWQKLKIAAEMFPFRFIMAQFKNKATGWTITEIGDQPKSEAA